LLKRENFKNESIFENGARDIMNTKPKGYAAVQNILERVRSELSWPPEAVDFLSRCIMARGGFKALAMVEELQNYNFYLAQLPAEIESVLEEYNETQSAMVCHLLKEGFDEVGENDGSAAVNRHRNIHHLQGILDSCRENAKWVAILRQRTRTICEDSDVIRSTTERRLSMNKRMFVASDDISMACAFVPQGFQMGNFLKFSRKILNDILIPAMRFAIKVESWPPQKGSRRTRVLAFHESSLNDATVGRGKLRQCKSCDGHFDSRWIRFGMCSICEDKRRQKDKNINECIFGCKLKSEAYCSHFGRCFVCDAPYSCEQLCRLSRGSGEVAISLVETLQPQLLLLDFDRTLCTTKSGASPLPVNKKNIQNGFGRQGRGKEGYTHSVDADLRIAIAVQQTFGSSHVVTRNSHKNEIEIFLKMNGMEKLANNVHVVPKKQSKGSYIEETFPIESSEEVTACLFIDDDIRELVSDPWMRSNEKIHRLLFSRAFQT